MAENKNFPIVHKTIGVARLHKRAIERAVEGLGMNRSRHHVLMSLSQCDKFKSQKDFADQMGVTPAAMTLALTALENDGLIERRSARDNRYNEITITERGREIVESSREKFSVVDSAMFKGFSAEECDIFLGYLERLEVNLKSIIGGEEGQ